MAIFWRCPECKSDQSIKSKKCKKCGALPPRTDKVYRIIVKHNGKVVTKTVPDNLELAKEIESKIKTELVEGTYFDRRKQAKLETTYSEFMEEHYLPYAKTKKSFNREETLWRLWIKPTLGNKQMDKLSPLDMEKLKKQMIEAGKAPRTAQYALAVVKHSLNKAKSWGFFTGDNPVSRVKAPKIDNKRARFLSPEEASTLLEELKKRSQQVYEMSFFSLYTGMRFGEIANLKWGDIDFSNDIIHIKDTKNGESRIAYITPEIKQMLQLKQAGNDDELIFKGANGKKLAQIPATFDTAVNHLGLNRGVTDKRDLVVFHTLRHTFASWLAIQGTPIYTISKLMGHKSLAMTERYSHLSPDSKRNAAASISKMFEKKVVEVDFNV